MIYQYANTTDSSKLRANKTLNEIMYVPKSRGFHFTKIVGLTDCFFFQEKSEKCFETQIMKTLGKKKKIGGFFLLKKK